MTSDHRSRVGFAWLVLALVSVVAWVSGNSAQLLLLGGLSLAIIGLAALVRGRLHWAPLNRRSGALSVAAGLVAALVGGAMSVHATSTIAAAPASPLRQSPPVSTPAPSESSKPPSVTPILTKSVARPPTSSVKGASALAALGTLKVKGRAPKTGYDRALFGQAWADVDRNGCDTRTICSDQVEQVAA